MRACRCSRNVTTTGSSAINATGNASGNALTGNSGNNTLNGGDHQVGFKPCAFVYSASTALRALPVVAANCFTLAAFVGTPHISDRAPSSKNQKHDG